MAHHPYSLSVPVQPITALKCDLGPHAVDHSRREPRANPVVLSVADGGTRPLDGNVPCRTCGISLKPLTQGRPAKLFPQLGRS
jgi:hypothetical protein